MWRALLLLWLHFKYAAFYKLLNKAGRGNIRRELSGVSPRRVNFRIKGAVSTSGENTIFLFLVRVTRSAGSHVELRMVRLNPPEATGSSQTNINTTVQKVQFVVDQSSARQTREWAAIQPIADPQCWNCLCSCFKCKKLLNTECDDCTNVKQMRQTHLMAWFVET